MALIDVGGGKYENLVTDAEYLDVIDRKISPEFARIIRQKITDENDKIEEMQSDLKWVEQDNTAHFEALQEIRSLAQLAFCEVEKMKRMNREKILQLFEEIENEAENAL